MTYRISAVTSSDHFSRGYRPRCARGAPLTQATRPDCLEPHVSTSSRPTPARTVRLLLVGLAVAGAASLAPAGPARADVGVFRPADDALGSTVAAHEQRADTETSETSNTDRRFVLPGVHGMDVSGHQGNVDWATARANGAGFAYVKATESTTYTNPYYPQQWNGSAAVGMVRGAYHFALPNTSTGTAQADFFVDHGGTWVADGKTLPPMLDIEYNPYGASCYGLTPTAMTAWIRAFSKEVKLRTTRAPLIFTTTTWWTACTGNSPAFGKTNPLNISRWNTEPGTLPAGWQTYKFWQHANDKVGPFPGDQEVFHGNLTQLTAFARGSGTATG